MNESTMGEASLEFAARYADFCKLEPWHGMRPDEEAMMHEEGGDSYSRRADVQDLMFSFLLAGGVKDWRAIGARVVGLIKDLCPAMIYGRATEELWAVGPFPAREACERLKSDREAVRKLLEFYFPAGAGWLWNGVMRVVLVSRVFQPDLLLVEFRRDDMESGWRVPSFEDLAILFGEMGEDATERERGLARSRWSARAQNVLRRPIEATGGSVPALFGKSSTVREKYRAAQMGNRNRAVKG